MTGLSAELMYPSHVIKFAHSGDRSQLSQNGIMMYIKKKGSQHNTKTPITIPRIRAARRSRDSEMRCLSSQHAVSLIGAAAGGGAAESDNSMAATVSVREFLRLSLLWFFATESSRSAIVATGRLGNGTCRLDRAIC